MADLAGENLHRKPADPGAMKSLSELMHLIALGRKVAVLPRVLTRPLRDDLITVPMTDLPPVTLLLAWPAHSTSLSVAALARAAAAAPGRVPWERSRLAIHGAWKSCSAIGLQLRCGGLPVRL